MVLEFLEDLRGAHFRYVPFVAAQYSLHIFIPKSSSASSGGSRFCASGARNLEHLGLPKRTVWLAGSIIQIVKSTVGYRPTAKILRQTFGPPWNGPVC